MAILAAAEHAGIDPRDIDSFASYSNGRNDPSRLAAALGAKELRLSNMQWGGGAAAVAMLLRPSAPARRTSWWCIALWRRASASASDALRPAGPCPGDIALINPYGIFVPAQRYALKFMRYMHEHGIRREAMRATSPICAVMLTEETYDSSRWISEPYRLFDCCQENDGAAAPVLEPEERAKDFRHKPAHVLAVALRCLQYPAEGPEWLRHHCRSWDMRWVAVEGKGRIWTWTRCWHPVHTALRNHGPYIAILVELPHAGNVRMLGNLLGDPHQEVMIGAAVEAVFEPHDDAAAPYALVQWRIA